MASDGHRAPPTDGHPAAAADAATTATPAAATAAAEAAPTEAEGPVTDPPLHSSHHPPLMETPPATPSTSADRPRPSATGPPWRLTPDPPELRIDIPAIREGQKFRLPTPGGYLEFKICGGSSSGFSSTSHPNRQADPPPIMPDSFKLV